MFAFSSPLHRICSIPVAALYHCDLELPRTLWNRIVNIVVSLSSYWTLRCADTIIAGSEDYLLHSRMLRGFSNKTIAIAPPITLPEPDLENIKWLRHRLAPEGEHLIGFVGRWAAEKGLEYLLGAIPIIRQAIPGIKIVCAGEYAAVGEEKYRQSMNAMIAAKQAPWETLGPLTSQELADFYGACDVTVLPSVNATESFGLIQVESMLCETPVVAADLPGVRVPVLTTGAGRLVPPRDSQHLAEAIIDVINNRGHYVRTRREIARAFSVESSLDQCESALKKLAAKDCNGSSVQPAGTSGVPVEMDPYKNRSIEDFLALLPPFHALVRSVEHRLLIQSGPLAEPILDLGCGDGRFASMLFSQPAAAAIDAKYSLCREARRLKSHRHVIHANATALPFPNESFQTVVANCVLEHIEDVDGAIGEVFRVLRPGGWFLFGVPSHRFGEMLFFSTLSRRMGLDRFSRTYADWFNRHSLHFHLYPPDEWMLRVLKCGFHVNHWEYYVSAAGMRAFDLSHYLSFFHLLSKRLTGKWVVFPLSLVNPLLARWLKPYAENAPEGEGAYIFFRAQKLGANFNGRDGAL
jgi:SAM-dependent methyltransferase